MKRRAGTGNDRGFILVPVLWTLGLLALVCAILTRTVGSDIKAASNALYQNDAELLSDGLARLAIRYVTAKGLDGNQSGVFVLNGTPHGCVQGDGRATISVTLATGLVDVNLASQDVLEKLYEGAGAQAPGSLAAATIDFRDADAVPLPQGAEDDAYVAAGLAYGPKNGEFSVVEEIDQVLGMTPAVAQRAARLLTTHSHQDLPDASVGVPQVSSLGLPSTFAGSYRPKALQILVSVSRRARPHVYSRQAVIVVQPRVQGGYVMTDWSRPDTVVTETTGDVSCVSSLLALDQ